MHAISSYRGNRPTNTQTHPQNKPTNRQNRLQYTAPQLARCSVITQHQLRWKCTGYQRLGLVQARKDDDDAVITSKLLLRPGAVELLIQCISCSRLGLLNSFLIVRWCWTLAMPWKLIAAITTTIAAWRSPASPSQPNNCHDNDALP